MGTKAKPGEFDCYANAEDDEPMFILLARDRHAADLVAHWAHTRQLEGTTDRAKIVEALDCSEAMREWRERHEAPDRREPRPLWRRLGVVFARWHNDLNAGTLRRTESGDSGHGGD